MPQARQGGIGVSALAFSRSKFEGTGFEYEQMEHTHVADALVDAGGDGRGRKGLSRRAKGEPVRLCDRDSTFAAAAYVFDVLRV